MKKGTLIILCLGMFLVGLLTSQVLRIEKVSAAKTSEYKVLVVRLDRGDSVGQKEGQRPFIGHKTEKIVGYEVRK